MLDTLSRKLYIQVMRGISIWEHIPYIPGTTTVYYNDNILVSSRRFSIKMPVATIFIKETMNG